MSLPDNTRADIEDGEVIDIVAEVLQSKTYDDGNTDVRLKDATGEVLRLKIWEGNADYTELEKDAWYLFRRARGDIYQGESNLTSNYGSIEFNRLDGPPDFVDRPTGPGSDRALDLGEPGVVGFDIETISTVPQAELDFDDSSHFELLAIGLGHAREMGQPAKTTVYIRDGTSPRDEISLLDSFCDYIEIRNPHSLVTFRGDFDRRHILGRAARLADVEEWSDERVRAIFENYTHDDIDRLGTLEDNIDVEPTFWDIYNHSLDPPTWRRSHPRWDDARPADDSVVTNRDIPYIGERLLELSDSSDRPDDEDREYRALKELIRHYTAADVEPLFRL